MAPPTASPILSEAMLQRFRERAPGYDRENRFFQEDFDELGQAGYLTLAVPRELGGRGHPANSALTHEIVAKLTLGIDPDARA